MDVVYRGVDTQLRFAGGCVPVKTCCFQGNHRLFALPKALAFPAPHLQNPAPAVRKGTAVKRSASIFAALTFTLLAIPLFAQINDTYVIPAAANASGAYGSRWMTQISIFNPQSYGMKVSVTYLPAGGGKAIEKLITVGPNSVAF